MLGRRCRLATKRGLYRSRRCCWRGRWWWEMYTTRGRAWPSSKTIGLWVLSTATTIIRRKWPTNEWFSTWTILIIDKYHKRGKDNHFRQFSTSFWVFRWHWWVLQCWTTFISCFFLWLFPKTPIACCWCSGWSWTNGYRTSFHGNSGFRQGCSWGWPLYLSHSSFRLRGHLLPTPVTIQLFQFDSEGHCSPLLVNSAWWFLVGISWWPTRNFELCFRQRQIFRAAVSSCCCSVRVLLWDVWWCFWDGIPQRGWGCRPKWFWVCIFSRSCLTVLLAGFSGGHFLPLLCFWGGFLRIRGWI